MNLLALLREGVGHVRALSGQDVPDEGASALRAWAQRAEQELAALQAIIPCTDCADQARYRLSGVKDAVCEAHAALYKQYTKLGIKPGEHVAPFGADEGLALCVLLRSWAEETNHLAGVHAAEEVMLNIIEVAGGNLAYNKTWEKWRLLWFKRINFRYDEDGMREAEVLGLPVREDLVRVG